VNQLCVRQSAAGDSASASVSSGGGAATLSKSERLLTGRCTSRRDIDFGRRVFRFCCWSAAARRSPLATGLMHRVDSISLPEGACVYYMQGPPRNQVDRAISPRRSHPLLLECFDRYIECSA
jgi:hypothetical protein